MPRRSNALLRAIVSVLLAVAAIAGAQPATRIARIGWLGAGDSANASEATADFRQGLRDLKYIDGQNITVEYRHAGGSAERLSEFAAELARSRVDVIVTVGESAALAAKKATNAVPIVATELGRDPVKAGLVASLGRPGGNLTGLASQSDELWEKRLGLLKEVAPRLTHVVVMSHSGNASCLAEVHAAAQGHRLRVSAVDVTNAAMREAMEPNGAIAICWDDATLPRASSIADFALTQRVPSIAPLREYVKAGALMSFGTSLPAQRRRAAYYVDRILKGTKPADLPVERPTLFELSVNLRTANAVGLGVPPALLILADEVVE